MYPSDFLYTKEHEWVKVEEDSCVLGITSYAQHELGDVVFIELPEVGQSFAAEDEVGTIESVKAVAEIYTPVAGEVTATNTAVEDDPEIVNRDPHGEGWLIRMKVEDPASFGQLMTPEQYQQYVSGDDG